MSYCKIILKPNKDESLLRFHPWVFSGAIASINGKPAEGDLVEVYKAPTCPSKKGGKSLPYPSIRGELGKASVADRRRISVEEDLPGGLGEASDADSRFLGIGHYQIGSIAVRILSFQPVDIDKDFWEERIRAAYVLRRALGLVEPAHDYTYRLIHGEGDRLPELSDPVHYNTYRHIHSEGDRLPGLAEAAHNNTYRLIHGEGDRLPGLIIDIYGATAVVQAHSAGMHHARKMIADALKEVLEDALQHIYYKSEGTLPFKAGLGNENEYLLGGDAGHDHIAIEKGLHFHIDWVKGQKTGFFTDQRENRLLLEQYASGRSVLNLFCYTGSFSVYAMRGGAKIVHSVDSSAKAIALAQKNMELNFPGDPRHQAFIDDAFVYLEKTGSLYDLIILDPPAFAKHKNVIHNALIGYRKLNAIAFAKIKPGGIIFTFSCSQVISKNDFRLAVFSAAALSGRPVRILHQLTQPADHPINIYHPEGEYLKGLVVEVV